MMQILMSFSCLFLFAMCKASSERNYHMFYQLCAARELPEMRSLKLGGPLLHAASDFIPALLMD